MIGRFPTEQEFINEKQQWKKARRAYENLEKKKRLDMLVMGVDYLRDYTVFNYEIDAELNKAYQFCREVQPDVPRKFLRL